MAKKEKTHEEAVAQLEVAKANVKESREALREFKQENGVKRNKEPEDAKVKKGLAAAEKTVEDAKEALELVKAEEKELRPRKDRKTIYEYPEGMTDADKKKFRAKKRREKKAAEKAALKAEAGEGKEEKADAKTEEKPDAGDKQPTRRKKRVKKEETED